VYDVQGRLVAQLVDEQQRPGKYDAFWDGRNAHGDKLSSGVYFLTLEFAGRIEAQNVLMRH
jgi:flagellar hook assembly protein FlgD